MNSLSNQKCLWIYIIIGLIIIFYFNNDIENFDNNKCKNKYGHNAFNINGKCAMCQLQTYPEEEVYIQIEDKPVIIPMKQQAVETETDNVEIGVIPEQEILGVNSEQVPIPKPIKTEMELLKLFDCKKYGQNAFYDKTTNNCNECPTGYYRTNEPISSLRACSKGVFGPFTYSNPIVIKNINKCKSKYGDDSFLEGTGCYQCPPGFKRSFGDINSTRACSQGFFGPSGKATYLGKI